MIDIIALKITNAISNGQLISDVLSKEEYKTYLNTYTYPIGVFPTYAFNSLITSLFATARERLNYFDSLLSFVLPEYYSTEELNVFKYYFLTMCGDATLYFNNLLNEIKEVINIHSDKTDVNYCIEEIKYALALFYARNQNTYKEELIQLITELETISDKHNTIILSQRETNYN